MIICLCISTLYYILALVPLAEKVLDVVMKDSQTLEFFFSLLALPSPVILYSSEVTLSFAALQGTMEDSPENDHGACAVAWLNPQSEPVLVMDTVDRYCASSQECMLEQYVSIRPQLPGRGQLLAYDLVR